MKKLSLNDLEELQCLLGRITNEIHTFRHVSDYLSKSLQKEIEKFNDKVTDELDARYEEIYG